MIYPFNTEITNLYCSFIVDGGLQNDTQKLQRLQNRALRICLRTVPADSNVDNIHNACHVVKLKGRRKYLIQCFMYKRAAADPTLRCGFRRTRADDKLIMQNKRANSATYQRSPLYRVSQKKLEHPFLDHSFSSLHSLPMIFSA